MPVSRNPAPNGLILPTPLSFLRRQEPRQTKPPSPDTAPFPIPRRLRYRLLMRRPCDAPMKEPRRRWRGYARPIRSREKIEKTKTRS